MELKLQDQLLFKEFDLVIDLCQPRDMYECSE